MAKEKADYNKTTWQPTAKRFVAFLDIMGFRDLVMRKSHNEIYELLNEISQLRLKIETVKETAPKNYQDCDNYTASFSDSIIIFSKNDKPESFDIFAAAVAVLVSGAIKKDIPIKGALAYGEISVNKTNQVYFGQPIIDAYIMEEDVEYYGVALHHSALDYLERHQNQIRFYSRFFECITPLKSGLISHTNLNWFSTLLTKEEKVNDESVTDYFNQKMKKFASMMSGRPRKYIDNTKHVYRCLLESKK